MTAAQRMQRETQAWWSGVGITAVVLALQAAVLLGQEGRRAGAAPAPEPTPTPTPLFLYEAEDLRDPFIPLFLKTPTNTPTWSPVPSATPTEKSAFSPTNTPTEVPTPNLNLQVIIWNPEKPAVVLNNRVYGVGGLVRAGPSDSDLARVVSIATSEVVVEYYREAFILSPAASNVLEEAVSQQLFMPEW